MSCSRDFFSSGRPFSFGLPAPTGFCSERTGPGAAPQVSSCLGSASEVLPLCDAAPPPPIDLQSAFTSSSGLFRSLRRVDSAPKLPSIFASATQVPPRFGAAPQAVSSTQPAQFQFGSATPAFSSASPTSIGFSYAAEAPSSTSPASFCFASAKQSHRASHKSAFPSVNLDHTNVSSNEIQSSVDQRTVSEVQSPLQESKLGSQLRFSGIFSAPPPPPPPAKGSHSLQAANIPPPPHIPILYQMNQACIMGLSFGGGGRASEAMQPRQPFFESSNPDPEELRLKWTKIFQLQHADGYWELTIELGELVNFNVDSFANVFLKNKGIHSLGVKAHADILKLVATLLVLQLMRMEKLEEGKLLQSLFCLKEPSQSRSERWEQVKKAVEWVCKADREYPCICSRLEFGWSWESSTRQLLGFERLTPFSPLIGLDLQKTTAPRLLY